MCRTCARRAVAHLMAACPPCQDGSWSVCLIDHGNHVHLRTCPRQLTAGRAAPRTAWLHIPVAWETLRLELPPQTRVHVHGAAKRSKGCPQELLEAIPDETHTSAQESGSTDDVCAVCYDNNNQPGTKLSVLPCGHRFHSSCVKTWLRRNNSCPHCRAPVTRDSLRRFGHLNNRQPAPSDGGALLRRSIRRPKAAEARGLRRPRDVHTQGDIAVSLRNVKIKLDNPCVREHGDHVLH